MTRIPGSPAARTGPRALLLAACLLLASCGSKNGSPDSGTDLPGDPAADLQEADLPEGDAPAPETSAEDIPVADVPAVDVPVAEVPVAEVPVADAPIVDAPVADAPIVDAPVVDTPAADAPNVDVPAADAPNVDVPAADAPATEVPYADLTNEDTPAVDNLPTDTPAPDDAVPDAPVPDVPSTPVWGWISVIEPNDTCDQWYLKTQWFGGVRAYFASAPSFNRALPHTLGFASPVATAGACTLYDTGIMSDACLGQCLCLDKGVECYTPDQTGRWCGEDEVCVDNPETPPEVFDHGMCVSLPPHGNVGTITLGGLKTAVAMTPDALDRYKAESLPDPNDLFDAGDAITASTSGGLLPPMTFAARGVAPLALPDSVVHVRPGTPATIRWTPADPESRVQVVLAIGSHDPNPLGGAILCDAPDGDGQVEVAGSLLDRLIYLGCDGAWMMKCSRITRYSRDLRTVGAREVELFVGSARNLQISRE